MTDADNDYDALTRLCASKDFSTVEALIAHLRKRSPGAVTAGEIAYAVNRPKRQVYCLIKLARRLLALTTGEAIPNVRRLGYRITSQPRALLFESIKSGNRADGHLGQEIANFRRVDRADLTSTEDVELYVSQQARIRLGEARLALSSDVAPAMARLRKNAQLTAVARADAATPWDDLGIDDPDSGKTN